MNINLIKTRLQIALIIVQIAAIVIGAFWAYHKFGWEKATVAPSLEPQLTVKIKLEKMEHKENGLIPFKVMMEIENESEIRVDIIGDWLTIEGVSIDPEEANISDKDYFSHALAKISDAESVSEAPSDKSRPPPNMKSLGKQQRPEMCEEVLDDHESLWRIPRYYGEKAPEIIFICSLFRMNWWVDPEDTESREIIAYIPDKYDFIRLRANVLYDSYDGSLSDNSRYKLKWQIADSKFSPTPESMMKNAEECYSLADSIAEFALN